MLFEVHTYILCISNHYKFYELEKYYIDFASIAVSTSASLTKVAYTSVSIIASTDVASVTAVAPAMVSIWSGPGWNGPD